MNNKTRVSKAYRGSEHIGWKKTIGGRSWFLQYGTTPSDEAKAITFAQALEAKWSLAKLSGAAELSQTEFDDIRHLVEGFPKWSAHRPSPHQLAQLVESSNVAEAVSSTNAHSVKVSPVPGNAILPNPNEIAISPCRSLFAAIEEFKQSTLRELKPDDSNGDHIFSRIDNITRACDAVQDMPMANLRRKELDDWLLSIRALPNKLTGKPLSPVTVRNIVSAVRAATTKFAEWEWWTPPILWEKAFKGYSIKKLETPAQRKKRKKRPPMHTIDEKRVLWNLSLPATKAFMALADWAGHTQTEIATMTFDEIKEENGDMYIDRDRNKTGVHGRWWIPPEAAVFIRMCVSKTPRDPELNPRDLAFLTPRGMPVVHRAKKGKKARSDYVGSNLWGALMRRAEMDYVKNISFKFMRKATAQMIRDDKNKEVSRTFLAHADEDVQDVAYTRACQRKVEVAVRKLHKTMKQMFERIKPQEWPEIRERIRQANGMQADEEYV